MLPVGDGAERTSTGSRLKLITLKTSRSNQMIKPINSDLKHRTANILRNDRVSLTNTTNLDNQAEKATNRYADNVVSITGFLKRDAGCGGDVA